MILIMKRFAFWFCLLSLLICFFNFSGNDDKNLLIFLTNPINLLLVEWLTDINTNPDTSKFFQPLIYLFHLLFWIVLGFVIDLLIKSIKKHKRDLRSK